MRQVAGIEKSPPSSCRLPLSKAKSVDLPPLRPTRPTSPGIEVTEALAEQHLEPPRSVTFLRMIILGSRDGASGAPRNSGGEHVAVEVIPATVLADKTAQFMESMAATGNAVTGDES